MFFTTGDGIRLYYEDDGAGPAVMMIHGAAGSAMSFDALRAELSHEFRVLALDLRGMSRSERVATVSPTDWCDDVLAVLDGLEIDRVHLVGCSLGARITGRIALDHPDRVVSLSVDAPLLAVSTSGEDNLNNRFTKLEASTEYDRTRWERFHGSDWQEVVSFYARARRNAELQRHLTLRPALPELRLPTLITRGDVDDPVHPLRDAVEWHAIHPGSWLWVAPGTGFSLTQQVPQEYAGVFRGFVAMIGSSGRLVDDMRG